MRSKGAAPIRLSSNTLVKDASAKNTTPVQGFALLSAPNVY